jgi:hypothetical protein
MNFMFYMITFHFKWNIVMHLFFGLVKYYNISFFLENSK